jgi:hypothetical protein
MDEEILASSYSETSHRHAVLADDGQTGCLYLHAPSEDSNSTTKVEKACFAYNRREPIDLKDVQRFRPGPPPIAKGYASEAAICNVPDSHDWRLLWSTDGTAVLLLRDEDPWCMIMPDQPHGYSKAIRAKGPWGSSWSDDAYRSVQWSDGLPAETDWRRDHEFTRLAGATTPPNDPT